MKELTPSSRQMFYMLLSKYKNFSQKNRLAKDGSFYYTDQRLAQELYLSSKTIQRSKKQLIKHGYITVEAGKHKGWATKYWIVPKVDKMSAFDEIGKIDNLSLKGDKLSSKAGQNVHPNELIIKKDNKDDGEIRHQDLRNLTEEQKEGIRAAVSFFGSKANAIEFFLNRGYPRNTLEQVLQDG